MGLVSVTKCALEVSCTWDALYKSTSLHFLPFYLTATLTLTVPATHSADYSIELSDYPGMMCAECWQCRMTGWINVCLVHRMYATLTPPVGRSLISTRVAVTRRAATSVYAMTDTRAMEKAAPYHINRLPRAADTK